MRDMVKDAVLRDHVAAVSCGIYKGEPVLDLDYAEDSNADADFNFVMTGTGGIVEVQGTAETTPFTEERFSELMAFAKKGIAELVQLQKLTVGVALNEVKACLDNSHLLAAAFCRGGLLRQLRRASGASDAGRRCGSGAMASQLSARLR